MNKKVITGLMAAILVLLPTTAFAATAGDINKDDFVDYEDYNALKQSLDENRNIKVTEINDLNKDGKVDFNDLVALKSQLKDTDILGDLDGDGVVTLNDKNLLLNALKSGTLKPVNVKDANGSMDVDLVDSGKYSYIRNNADINKDGLVNFSDFRIFPFKTTTVKGDINADGVLNKKDVTLFRQYLNNKEVEIAGSVADYNGDGAVNYTDYILIREATK